MIPNEVLLQMKRREGNTHIPGGSKWDWTRSEA